jgi:hypothetical protein
MGNIGSHVDITSGRCETFASQSAWNNPDTIWITLRGLVNWTCNVFMPVYAVL